MGVGGCRGKERSRWPAGRRHRGVSPPPPHPPHPPLPPPPPPDPPPPRPQIGNFKNISMGQGQEAPAEAIVQRFAKDGGWIMLQNCHLMENWVPSLERLLEVVQEYAHKQFRCYISAEAPSMDWMKNMPESLLQSCVKVANEAPADVKSNLMRAWTEFSQVQGSGGGGRTCPFISSCLLPTAEPSRLPPPPPPPLPTIYSPLPPCLVRSASIRTPNQKSSRRSSSASATSTPSCAAAVGSGLKGGCAWPTARPIRTTRGT